MQLLERAVGLRRDRADVPHLGFARLHGARCGLDARP